MDEISKTGLPAKDWTCLFTFIQGRTHGGGAVPLPLELRAITLFKSETEERSA